MIERFIKHELTMRRWRHFKSDKLAMGSVICIIFFIFLSFTAEMWANSKPLIMKRNGNIYFPIFSHYHPKEFGITDSLTVNYRELRKNKKEGDWSIWPIVEWDPYEKNDNLESYPAPPTKVNWFGTDDRGRDVFTRILYGLRYGIIFAFFVWLICAIIAIILGGLMGYLGGRVDFYGQRIIEILSTVPQLLLLIFLISIFQPSLFLLIFIFCLFGWISLSYYVRAEFLKNRKREFVEAARSMGAKTPRILFKHILPNSLGPIITYSPFIISSNITALAGLDYLGFGLEIPTPSWGELLNQAYKYFRIAWWLAVYPSLALFGTLTMLSLIGDGIRNAIDPYKN